MSDSPVKRILILTANPKNTSRLRLDEEVREIEAGLTRAKMRDKFELIQKWATRPRDMQRAILEINPNIVHFSGHGTKDEGLALEDDTGQVKFVTAEALKGLFELFSEEIECVMLNACYSEVQAEAISKHITYVIGMNQSIGDQAALEFSVGFYDALGAGKSIEFAYKFGCNAIRMAGICEFSTPILKKVYNRKNLCLKEEDIEPIKPIISEHFFEKKLHKSSYVRLIASEDKTETSELLIIDQVIAQAWNLPPQDIYIYQDITLASITIEDLQTRKIVWDKILWIQASDLFLPELTFIDFEDALPGALLPKEIQPLIFQGNRITPLLPINSILLNYFNSEDLASKIQLCPLIKEEAYFVKITLELPLAGPENGNPPRILVISKEYLLKPENVLINIPVLEIWPNFRIKNWKEYYGFYYDAECGEETFQVSFPAIKDNNSFKDKAGGVYQIVRLENFPSFIQCMRFQNNTIITGLILLKSPIDIKPSNDWTVGVDLGTSFTNVYVSSEHGTPQSFEMLNLHHKVTDSSNDTRIPVLYEYFIPISQSLPIANIVTMRGRRNFGNNLSPKAILDGRIYIPNVSRFRPDESWIETNLKWRNVKESRLFLAQLALHISASAVRNGIRQIQWSLSFPSYYSREDKRQYVRTWQILSEELGKKTGIQYNCPELNNTEFLRTDSLAIAQYFADLEQHNLTYSTCIGIEDLTTSISIWEENNLIYQCSLRLARQDLFAQFLELNPTFFKEKFINNRVYIDKKRGVSVVLDSFLRFASEDWLIQIKPQLIDDPDFQEFIQLTNIGLAGIYYYTGFLLKVLSQEGKYRRAEITPVYLGGRGSQLLNWLDLTGQFDQYSEINELLSRILSLGSGFPDTHAMTWLSRMPGDEVACGLVLNMSRLRGIDSKIPDLIAGETCEVNEHIIAAEERLEDRYIGDNISNFKIPELSELSKFLYDFHTALRDLRIEGIQPLKGYILNPATTANKELWRNTYRELSNLLLEFRSDSNSVRLEPPFILGLKALLRVLGKRWASKKEGVDT
ncbi:CHAT domain-containing protein [Nostoc sp.]|uniref:CHAT domain-containing protein n=1 Tax=Nostoc sp. TaxID=1180 RepID=UPI002FFA7862